MDESRFLISPADLHAQLGAACAPTVVDVRRQPDFTSDDTMIASAIRRAPQGVESWIDSLRLDTPVVVYCAHGGTVSQDIAAALREAGLDARYLQGGMEEWTALALPKMTKRAVTGKWITRSRPKIDRIACPWLVRRFIDPSAEFMYVPKERVFEVARESGAIPYDIPGAEPYSHDGDRCSFDGFLRVFDVHDTALDHLALIVRAADTGRLDLTPQAAGLLAVSLGLSAIHASDDHAMLEQGMLVYDALYAWCREATTETHAWTPAQ